MPRKTKDQTEKEELKKKESTAKKATAATKKSPAKKTTTTKKAATTKKSTTEKKATATKKASTTKKATATKKATTSTKKAGTSKTSSAKKVAPVKEEKASVAKKATTTKSSATKKAASTAKKATAAKKASTKKSSTAKKATTKKAATSKATTTKKAATKKASTKKTTRKTTKKALAKVEALPLVEYYDLPYRYNQTVVKLLAQTPTTLFVYWDISDDDRNNYIKTYGEHFFEETKPVLIIKNTTMNYSFEVEINDFANSWYLHVNDSKCDYSIELGRRPVSYEVKNRIETDYIYVTTSNAIESPNDRILFNIDEQRVYYRNVKNNVTSTRAISYINSMGRIYNIYELYDLLYENEKGDKDFADALKGMPSSSGLSSSTSSWFK